MRTISRFEANLVRLTRGIVQQAPTAQVSPILARPLSRPKCLSRDAVALVQDALAKGCIHWLARHGWMRDRFLRDGRPVQGRLWQRTKPSALGLSFSANAMELLLQLTAGSHGSNVPGIGELTVADRLLLLMTFNVIRATDAGEKLRNTWTPIYQDGLCRLAFTEELTDSQAPYRIDWSAWTSEPGWSILEALQGWLADRFVALERDKERISAAGRMRNIGAAQARVFGEYRSAIDHASRRDLARCFLDAARRILHDQASARNWIGNLDVGRQRLDQRRAIYQHALAFVREIESLGAWQEQAIGVRYVDEGYAASQLWKSDWERFAGAASVDRARAMLREVGPN
ncbi:MAG: hypothetical protein HYR84_01420 [Planctomycetes bacterium]|nr:hypothetical protein [Planctomycetota bacterium]